MENYEFRVREHGFWCRGCHVLAMKGEKSSSPTCIIAGKGEVHASRDSEAQFS